MEGEEGVREANPVEDQVEVRVVTWFNYVTDDTCTQGTDKELN